MAENKKLQEAKELITVEMLESMTYSEEIHLNDKYCLYHYSEEEIIVLNESEEWIEIYQLSVNYDNYEINYEKL